MSALSSHLEVISTHNGTTARQTYERGIATLPLATIDPAPRGTMMRFRPDAEIFGEHQLDRVRIATRMQELAWLLPKLAITFQGERVVGTGGLAGWAASEGPIEARFATSTTIGDVAVDVALAWRGSGDPIVRGFANLRATEGTHVDAIWTGLEATRMLGRPLAHRDVLAPGLIAIVHVGMANPGYTAMARTQITAPEAGTAVEAVIVEHLTRALETDDQLRRFMLARVIR